MSFIYPVAVPFGPGQTGLSATVEIGTGAPVTYGAPAALTDEGNGGYSGAVALAYNTPYVLRFNDGLGNISYDSVAPRPDPTAAVPVSGNVTVGGYATGQDPASLILVTPANKLATDSSGRVGVNNFPVEFLTSAEQSELTAAVNDLVSLLGRTDTAPTVSTISGTLSTVQGVINAIATDYQQRTAAVVLPTSPPAAYATSAAQATLATTLGLVKVVTDKLATMLETIGGGIYRLTVAALFNAPTGGGGGADPWATDLATGGYTGNQAGALMANTAGKVQQIGNGAITVQNPVDADGSVRLVRGASYYAADGLALEWSADTWPNLTGAAIQFVVEGGVLSVAGSVVTAGSGTQKVRAELSATDSGALVGESYRFNVVATLAGSGHVDAIVPESTITVTDKF